MNRLYIYAFVAVLTMVGSVSYAAYEVREDMLNLVVVVPDPQAEAFKANNEKPKTGDYAFGEVSLSLRETATFPGGLTLTPLRVVEDSRCPMNARCIWAGTVKVEVEVVSGMGKSTSTLELGKTLTTEAESIRLDSVRPETVAGEEIPAAEYRFTFTVSKRATADIDPPQGKCYVGGCSSQLCTDRPDAVSTCEYREEYACYQTARCERQASGQCGWTPSAELQACLADKQ